LLEEVRFIPSLKHSLISLGELENNGYVFKGEQRMLKVMKGSRVVMKDVRKNDLYALEGFAVPDSTSNAKMIV